MKIIDVPQRSDDWFNLRRQKIGASDCAKILDLHPYEGPKHVWREKMLGIQKPISKAMQEGIDYEDEVRDLCSERFEMHFESIVALADDRNWQLASLDGWNPETRTILEIKIVGENTFRRAVAGEYIECYAWQVQHQWAVFDANAAWLVFAKKEKESFKLFPIEQLKSERMIERLIREEEFFYKENILRFKEPDFKL